MANLQDLLICAAMGFVVSLIAIVVILRAWRRSSPLASMAEFRPAKDGGYTLIPRLGGLPLAAAFAVLGGMAWTSLIVVQIDPLHGVIFVAALAMFGLGLWDDLRGLGAGYRLAGQVVIASAVFFLGLGVHRIKIPLAAQVFDLEIYAWPLTVLWLVAMTNIIRLTDVADGLAGIIALMLMIFLSVVSPGGDMAGLVAVSMAGALLAFLWFNLPPATLCLGSSGSYLLGFLIGSLSLYNSHKGQVVAAILAPLLVLMVPILDTALAAARRGMLGLPLFHPYGRQLPQRLLRDGVARDSLPWRIFVFTALLLGLALVAFCWRGESLPVVLVGATLAMLWLAARYGFGAGWIHGRAGRAEPSKSRTDIPYALAQSDWLGMEGRRGRSLEAIGEDTAWIAGKLGFASLGIHMEDSEKVWRMTSCETKCTQQSGTEAEDFRVLKSTDGCQCNIFRHRLPGHPTCWMELQTPDLGKSASSEFQIMSQVLAAGWVKAVGDWRARNLNNKVTK